LLTGTKFGESDETEIVGTETAIKVRKKTKGKREF